MVRVFIEKDALQGDMISVIGEDAHHLRDVLRMREGETVLACAGDEWEYTCEIAAFSESEVALRVIDAQKPKKELPCKITLLQCLPKGDKMETVIQKAVELGASAIVPVASSRCVVKLDAKKAEAKTRRWNAIARSAAEQSKRMIIPEVSQVVSFAEVLAQRVSDLPYPQAGALRRPALAEPEPAPREAYVPLPVEGSASVPAEGTEGQKRTAPVLLMPYENAEGMEKTRKLLQSIEPGRDVYILIGPEGGFSDEEVTMAKEAGFETITLGKRILRTETAGLATLAMLIFVLEE